MDFSREQARALYEVGIDVRENADKQAAKLRMMYDGNLRQVPSRDSYRIKSLESTVSEQSKVITELRNALDELKKRGIP